MSRLDDAEIERLAAEAEAGYDPAKLKLRRVLLPDITLDTVERLAKGWDSGHGSLILRIVAEDRRLRAEVERLRIKSGTDDEEITVLKQVVLARNADITRLLAHRE